MTLTCPSCGSTDVNVTTSQRSVAAPLGPSVSFEVETDTCATCGEVGDFTKRNDELIRTAENKSAVTSIESMLGTLSHHGCSMAYMERSLSLPTRTLARWKAGEGISAAGVTLLRLVATYPWLLEVADARFAPRFAASKLVIESGKVLGNVVQAMILGPTVPTYNVASHELPSAEVRHDVWSSADRPISTSIGCPAQLVAAT